LKLATLILLVTSEVNMRMILLFLACFGVSANEWTAEDKKMHLGAGVLIGHLTYGITEDRLKSYLVCIGAGVAKEVIDEIDYGGFDEKDLAVTGVGCAAGVEISRQLILYSDGNHAGIAFKW